MAFAVRRSGEKSLNAFCHGLGAGHSGAPISEEHDSRFGCHLSARGGIGELRCRCSSGDKPGIKISGGVMGISFLKRCKSNSLGRLFEMFR
jgi:hypothetical protein